MYVICVTGFDVFTSTGIGARNITTVKNIMNGYVFYYVIPVSNFMEEWESMYITVSLMYVWWMNWRLEKHVIAPDVKIRVYF